jgi:hypothetical protein
MDSKAGGNAHDTMSNKPEYYGEVILEREQNGDQVLVFPTSKMSML